MSGPSRPPRGDERQQVVDPSHRCNYSQIPHLLLDDVAAGRLHPAAVVLYLHYRRAAFEQHGQPVAETLRETKQRTGLSNGTILAAREELMKWAWLTVEKDGNRSGQSVTITLVERWEDNCERHGHLGQKLTKSEELGRIPAKFGQKPAKFGRKLTKSHLSADLLNTLEDVKDPLGVDQNGAARAAGLEPQLPGMLSEVPPSASMAHSGASYAAEQLLDGLYRDGLGCKPTRETRELESARDLIADGATPADAAAWAREMVADGHLQIITATTFSKAWPGWRARRRREAVPPRSGYEHDPWAGGRPPIDDADFAKLAAM